VPIHNQTQNSIVSIPIRRTDRFLARLTGLLGTKVNHLNYGVLFDHCRSIHTFGMQYALDVLFLDQNGIIIEIVQNVRPNRIMKGNRYTDQVIEFKAGTLDHLPLEIGDQLTVESRDQHISDLKGLCDLLHWPSNLFIALVWSRFVMHMLSEWTIRPSLVNSGLLIHNTILMLLFLTRRRVRDASGRVQDWLIPFCTVLCTLGLRVDSSSSGWNSVSLVIQGIGVICMIVSLFSLGRSFGIVPSNRSVKVSGAYRFIRHPLYVSELIFYTGFMLGNLSLWNTGLIALILIGQIWRSTLEERLLSQDPVYLNYCLQVRYRFIPGLY